MFECKVCERKFETRSSYAGHMSGHKRRDSTSFIGWTISFCLYCKGEIKHRTSQSSGQYCSNKCQAEQHYKTVTLSNFFAGNISNRDTIRRILCREVRDCCYECGTKEWQGKPLVLVVNHKDGNAGNNDPENLELLCPNCNSQTPTFSGRNRGNGRRARGLPL